MRLSFWLSCANLLLERKLYCSMRRSPTNGLCPCQDQSVRRKASRCPPSGFTFGGVVFQVGRGAQHAQAAAVAVPLFIEIYQYGK